MTKVAYSYAVLRYVHDPAAGESLNVGVIAYAPTVPWVGVRVEKRFRRLSETFRNFDRDNFRSILRRVENAVESLQARLTELPGLENLPEDVRGVAAHVWPDPDVSFRFGSMFTGISSDPELMLDELFDRMVRSQTPQAIQRQTEANLWNAFSTALAQAEVLAMLQPKSFDVDGVDINFDHAFKNGKWHVLQPVTMDYKNPGRIEREATIWLGKGTALKEHPELGRLYLLLGRPSSDATEIRRAFLNAKRLLNKMPTPGRIVEEDDSESFANELAAFIESHPREP